MPSQPHTIGGPGHFIARHSCNLSGFPLDLLKGDTPMTQSSQFDAISMSRLP